MDKRLLLASPHMSDEGYELEYIHDGEVPFLPFCVPRHANLLILEKLDRVIVRCFHLIPRSAQVILFYHVTTCDSLYVLLIE